MKHRKTRSRGAAATALAALLALAGVGGAAANSYISNVTSADRTVVSGCVIRFLPEDDGRPSIHANGAHQCSGINGVSVNQHGEVVLHQTVKDVNRYSVLYIQAQADEQLVTRGVTAGVSGGTGESRIRLYSSKLGQQLDMTKASHRAQISCDTCNIWIGAIHLDRGQP